MVIRFGESAEVVGQEVVGRRHAEQREARGLTQQAAAAGPLATVAAHRRQAHVSADADPVQLIT